MGSISQTTPSQTTGKYLEEQRVEANPLSSWCGHPLGTHGETRLFGVPRELSMDWRNYLINWPLQ